MFRALNRLASTPLFLNKPKSWNSSRTTPILASRTYGCLTRSPVEHKWFGFLDCCNRLWSRDIVICSKNKGKRKTVKAVAKRFKRTGSGALKYWRAGKNHKMIVKSSRARRNLRKPSYANKTQLKTLNKMLSGI